MKFEFSDLAYEYEDISLSELSEFVERNIKHVDGKKWPEEQIGHFSDVLADISSLCDTKAFSPVVSIVVDDECLGADFFQTCKVIFQTELNTTNHDYLIVECFNVLTYSLPIEFYNIKKNIHNIIEMMKYYESQEGDKPISEEQKIELLARNIAHYFNGKMYFESKALGTKFELLKRGADRFKWGESDKIQKHIFDIYHFSPIECYNNLAIYMTRDRFFEYGDYKDGEEYKALIGGLA